MAHTHAGTFTVIGNEIRVNRDIASVSPFQQPFPFRVIREQFVDRSMGARGECYADAALPR